MNFLRKVFRSKKRSKARKNSRLDDAGDNSPQDSRLPEVHTDRPTAAPTSLQGYVPSPKPYYRTQPSAASRLPDNVLERILSYVCPHSTDHSYLSAEESTTESGCMLCDMRDLSRCGLVSRRWHVVAEQLQYTSIRLDSVHYCGLENELQLRRKRGNFFQKKYEPPTEVPEKRMRLLYRTFQENEHIAFLVRYIKMPYMTRETCKADLARLVSLTPELLYCDAPEGVFSDDDPSCAGLRAILYARCPELRMMTWTIGSEKNFVDLWVQPPWQRLEIVVLLSLRIENSDLVRVLNTLTSLRELTLKALPWISDGIFNMAPNSAGIFPALSKLVLEDMASISLEGLKQYLDRPIVAASLTELSLTNSTIPAPSLPTLLSSCPSLESLTFRAVVARALPTPEPPHLKSRTLRLLRYELTSAASSRALANPTPSHYSHLASSLLSSSLPALTTLYVREPQFADRLARNHHNNNALPRPLTIHAKSPEQDHLDWTKFLVVPPPPRSTRQLEVRALWEMPRNSLTADFSDPRMSGLFKAIECADIIVPPAPGFVTGGRPGSHGTESVKKKGHSRGGSFASVPPSPGFATREKRNSRQDIWR